MGKSLALASVLVVFACSAAWGTNYTWIYPSGATSADTDSAWSPTGHPSTSADNVLINVSGSTAQAQNHNYKYGQLMVNAGAFSTPGWTYTLTLAADNGLSGDWIMKGASSWDGYGGNKTIDVAGNIRLANGSFTGNAHHYANVIMRGVGKVLDDNDNTDYWRSFTVTDCASVSLGTSGNATSNRALTYTFNGTVTGGTWVVWNPDTTTSTATIGPNGKFTGGTLALSQVPNAIYTARIISRGGQFNTLDTTPGYINGGTNAYRTIRLGGNLDVVNLRYDYNFGSYTGGRRFRDLLTTDNGSGVYANILVRGDFNAGGTNWIGGSAQYVFAANSSQITVKGNSSFDNNLWILGGTSTWRFGGNVNFMPAFIFDNTNMRSTKVIFDGAGTGKAQNVATRSLVLGNVSVNNPGGTVTLGGAAGDQLMLVGNFSVDCGTLATAGHYIYFLGGKNTQATAENLTMASGSLDKVWVAAGSPTFIQLQTNVTINSTLRIDNGCAVVLNNHTLTLTGVPITTTQAYDLGMIYKSWADVSAIPEPGTCLLIGTGAIGLLGWMRRRKIN
jgi:hypothetical protein